MSDNSPYSLGAASPHDWPFVEALHRMAHVTPWVLSPSEANFLHRLQEPDAITQIIRRGTQPFGYILMRFSDWLLELNQIVVLEPRKGAGRFALQHAIDRGLNDLKVHRIYLEIVESNEASRALCESLGFRAEGVFRDGYYSDKTGFQNLIPYGLLASDVATACRP